MATERSIGTTIAESTPTTTPLPRPSAGAPNVVVIVLDDVGFAQLAPFGSDISMPTIAGLADGGLRFRNYHVTAMCSPTRAAMLTGRNHHAVGMGFLPEIPIGFPGYNARIPRSAAAMPRLLRDAGFSTFAVGKWHLTPRWEVSASGPFGQWPLGVGFERYYGFLSGDTNQFAPELVCDNGYVEAPATPAEGYHVTTDLVDRAIRFLRDQQQATPSKPFLLWLATGAQHAPHQAPAEWIERYRGRFDQGWDRWRDEVFARQVAAGVVPPDTRNTPRPPWVTAWDTLSADERRLYARMMEVYAGFLSHTDDQIGRLITHLRTEGLLDNTMIVLASDNGASAEGGPHGSFNEHRFTHDRLDDPADTLARIDELGGPRSYNHYAWGWAWAGNTPFRLWKRYTWLGGTRTPLIVHWPARVTGSDRGTIRTQFCHAVDLLPTVLEATGVKMPEKVDGVVQQRVDGASLLGVIDDPAAPSPRDTQYFELLGSRSLYHDGWKVTTDHVGAQITVERELLVGSREFADDHWALFHVDEDFAESNDLAEAEPARTDDLVARWWSEAERNQVLPLDDTFIGRAMAMDPNPWPPGAVGTYRLGGGPVAEDVLPAMGGGFTLTAEVMIAPGEAPRGIVATLGDWNSGWSLYLLEGRLHATFSLFGDPVDLAATTSVDAGPHELTLEYRRVPAGGGPVTLFVDDAAVAEAEIPIDLPFRWQIGGAGLRIGHDRGLPVSENYEPPFACNATIEVVRILSHALAPADPDSFPRRVMHHE